jgi:hypothetical protein
LGLRIEYCSSANSIAFAVMDNTGLLIIAEFVSAEESTSSVQAIAGRLIDGHRFPPDPNPNHLALIEKSWFLFLCL